MIKLLDLFSGIGGFSLAAHWAGIETVAFCEQDKFCQKVLKKHWPAVLIFDDIKKMRGDEVGTVNIISGGFPCQPFSVAGQRRGSKDDRALWPEMLRVIKEVRPNWVIGENVVGFVNMGLDDAIAGLESKGYEVQSFIIPACAVNAPHRRDRVWIVANANGEHAQRQWEKCWVERSLGLCDREIRGGEIARTIKSGLGRVVNGIPARLDGHFDTEPNIPRLTQEKKSRTSRLKALGNAIVPQVAFEIFKAIVEIEKTKKGELTC